MTLTQQLLSVGIAALVTALIRALPFLVFSGRREPPAFVTWLGRQLPRAVMGMLVVYCLKDQTLAQAPWGIPALAGIAATAGLHLWRRQMILSIAGGTAVFMLLSRLMG